MADAKAIFVDNANLWHMGRVNGIGELRFAALFNILTKEVGNASVCFGRPVYVLKPEQAEKKGGRLSQEGFEVVPVETDGGADDQEIIRRINNLTADEVSEIILVSANFKDFRECLDAKVKMGIRVIIVATKTIDKDTERPMLSVDFDEMRGDVMEFVELADFKKRLTRKPWIEKEKVVPDAPAVASFSKSAIEESSDLAKLPLATKKITPQPPLLTRTINLSLEVGVSDFDSVLNAVSAILKMPVVLKSTLEIK